MATKGTAKKSPKQVTSDLASFQQNVDSWIKKMNTELNQIGDIPDLVEENVCNIEHNYSLIRELKEEIKELREEMKIIKATQLFMLEQSM